MDAVVDGAAAEVWRYYDPKNTGVMKKAAIQQFLKGENSTSQVSCCSLSALARLSQIAWTSTP